MIPNSEKKIKTSDWGFLTHKPPSCRYARTDLLGLNPRSNKHTYSEKKHSKQQTPSNDTPNTLFDLKCCSKLLVG